MHRPSTVKGYRDLWNNHLKARSVGLWMREIRTCDVQRILDDIAKPGTLSSNSLRHIKSHISAIFSYAKQQGYFDGENPARNTAIPRRGLRKKPTLTVLKKSRISFRCYLNPPPPFLLLRRLRGRDPVRFAVCCGKTIATTKSK